MKLAEIRSEREKEERMLKYHTKVVDMILKAVFSERGNDGKTI